MDEQTRNLREGYDRVAAEYVARISDELAGKPFDRALLDRFAEMVKPLGPIGDLGCGPGHVARYLHERGVEVIGIDLSPQMVAQARRLSPAIAFREGTMLALEFEDASLGGIVAFYSIIHISRDQLAVAFSEMLRVLRPDGRVLLAFHIGDEDRRIEDFFGQPVSIDFLFFTREEIEQHLEDAGFVVNESVERPPYVGVEVETQRAYILARKPVGTATG